MFCEILMAVNKKFTVFMDVTSCWLVDMCHLFFYHKDSDNKLLCNTGNYHTTVTHPTEP